MALSSHSPSGRRFSLDSVPECEMPPETDRSIRDLLCQCFPSDAPAFFQSRIWHHSRPEYTIVHRDANRVVGHVSVVVRTVRCGPRGVRVAGVQSLCVAPELRGTGLSRQLMRVSMDHAVDRGIDFGLLFCTQPLQRFYESLGWRRIDTPVLMADASGQRVPIPDKNMTMKRELTGAGFPPGPIDLQGPDW